MVLKIVRGRTLPIGVDLGSSAVKLAQLRLSEGGIDLVAMGQAEIPRPCRQDASRRLECLCQGIRSVLKGNPFKGQQAILSLPAPDTFVQHVKIPKLPPQEAALAVRDELQGKLPCPIEDAIVRHVIAGDVYGEGETRQEAIVVAVPRRTLEDCLGMARRAKLDVVGVNIEPFAVVECFARLFKRDDDAHRTVLFVDMGAVSTQVVLAHGRRTIFARNLAMGGDHLDQVIAQKKNVPIEKAQVMRRGLITGDIDKDQAEELYRLLDEPLDLVAGEMTMCLRYCESVFRNQSIERAVFVGGEAADKRLCQSLAQRLSLPAQIGDPLIRVRYTAGWQGPFAMDRRVPQPRWAVAVGLSLGADQAA